MARYGKVESGFWHNPKVRHLPEKSKFLMLYLLSCPHGNAAGCFVLPDGYISADLSWPLETVSETLSELFQNGLIERDETTNLLRIIGWWGHNAIENANVAKHIAKEICSLPNCDVKQALIDDLLEIEDLHQTVRQTLSERLGKPFRNQEPNLTQQEPNQSGRVAKATVPTNEEFEEFWKAYPRRQGDNPKAPARKSFEAAVRKGADPQAIVAGVKAACARNRDKIGTEFIPQAVTWLRQERWKDYAQLAASADADQPDWDRLVREYRETNGNRWPMKLGPEPGYGGCRAPKDILEKYGLSGGQIPLNTGPPAERVGA